MGDYSNRPDFKRPTRQALETAMRSLRDQMKGPVHMDMNPRIILGPHTRTCPSCGNPAAPDDDACQTCGAMDGARLRELPKGPCRHCNVSFVMGSCPMLECPDWP